MAPAAGAPPGGAGIGRSPHDTGTLRSSIPPSRRESTTPRWGVVTWPGEPAWIVATARRPALRAVSAAKPSVAPVSRKKVAGAPPFTEASTIGSGSTVTQGNRAVRAPRIWYGGPLTLAYWVAIESWPAARS